MKVHELKTIKPHYGDIESGKKTFEVRTNDRNFQVGDVLHLREYDDKKTDYTGKEVLVDVNHIFTGGEYGLHHKSCVMSIVVFKTIDQSHLPF